MKNAFISLLCFALFSLSSQILNAQSPNWLWAKSAGGSSNDIGNSITIDGSGNSYVTGKFQSSTITVGSTTLTNNGGEDIFLAKYNSSGNVIWAKSAGGSNNDRGLSIATDSNANCYVAGWFSSDTITFGSSTLINNGSGDIFIVKYDSSGNLLWAKSAGGSSDDGAYAITTDKNGNCYVTGWYYSSTLTFGSVTLNNAVFEETFVVKYNSSGNVLWAKCSAGNNDDIGQSIAVDDIGNCYVAGRFNSSSFIFGSTNLSSNGNWDGFLIKYDSSGNEMWAKSAGGIGDDRAYDVATGATGNIYITGYFFSNPITIGSTTLTNNGSGDIFVIKYDVSGNVLWGKSLGGSGWDAGTSIATDANEYIFITGFFASTPLIFGIDTLKISGFLSDFFIANYDSSGNEIWAMSAIGTGQEMSYGIATYGNGTCYATGEFSSSKLAFGNDTIIKNGSSDIFIAKLKGDCFIYFSQSQTICSGQSWAVGTHSYTSTGIYLDTLNSINSCDTIITTNLTVSDTIKNTNNVIICNGDSFRVGTNVYSVGGTYKDSLVASGGCDSIVTTNLTILSNSSFSQSPSICNGQSITVSNNTYLSNGTYQDTLTAANGCDSIVTTNLTVLSNSSYSQTPIICSGQSLTVGSYTHSTGGIYIDTIMAANGCDSIVNTNLTVLSNSSFSQTLSICNGQSVIVGGNTYSTSGNYTDIFTAANGCDSIVATNLTVNSAYSQPGSPDSTFSADGKVTTSISGVEDRGLSLAIQSDGKIVVAGSSFNGSNNDFALIRYNIDGSLDNSFGTNGKVTTAIGSSDDVGNSAIIQTDGKIVVGGNSWSGASFDFALVRYNTNGTLDNSFGSSGKIIASGVSGYPSAIATPDRLIALQGDGKIVIVGPGFVIGRYNSNGTIDSTFDIDGIVKTSFGNHTSDNAHSVSIQSDGKIVVVGYGSPSPLTNYDFVLARYNSDGSLDSTFDFDGKVITDIGSNDDYAYSVAIQNDGKIVAAGSINNGSPSYDDLALVRYNSNGSLDNTLGISGVVTDFGSTGEFAASVAIQSDGKIIIAGKSNNGSDYDFALVRYKSDGSLDSTFDSDGKITTDFGSNDAANSVAIQTDGKIVMVGDNYSSFAVVRYNSEINFPINSSQTLFLCSGKNITVGGNTYNSTGIYSDTLSSVGGCDSIVTTNLTVTDSIFSTNNFTICDGDNIVVGSNSYTSNGTYLDTIISFGGCDSIVTTNLTVLSKSIFSQSPIICNGQNVTVGSNIYDTTGIYTDTLNAANGCDSIVTTNLTVKDTSTSTLNQTACDSFTLNGTTYNSSGTYTQILTNAANCDSMLTLILTVNSAYARTMNDTICNGDSVRVGNSIYKTTGNYLDTLIAVNTCDSIITTNLLVNTCNGINTVTKQDVGIKIYPNPFNHTATIEIKNVEVIMKNVELKIYDVLGQEVLKQQIIIPKSQILNPNLPSGIYFYKVFSNSKEIIGNGKLMIEKSIGASYH